MTADADETLIRHRVRLPARASPRLPMTLAAYPGWSSPDDRTGIDGSPLTAGSIINGRFILEESLGRGSMGTVFRARYLREWEARDGKPHVAIKFFNQDVLQYPAALQSLRHAFLESQTLAHPNIATVLEFDRDGAHVYRVTELLEGASLEHLIKLRRDVGLGVKDAIRVIRGFCQALDYAHAHGLLHADFKPANAFLTTSGVAKVLDIGIARAVKIDDQPEADRFTLFDPRTSGALTPAYAGCEICEGMAPDPRDDIYAVACVTYELITGSHPFNCLSARQAEKARLRPARPPGMSLRQWRALQRGLSFRRDGRPRSAMAFLDGIRPPIGSPAVYSMVGAVALVSVALAAAPLWNQLDRLRDRDKLSALASADAHRIGPILGALRTLEPARRASLFVHADVRAGLIKYYAGRVSALVDAGAGRYDYPAAESLVRELEAFFPDSQDVRNIRDHLASKKSAQLRHLNDDFEIDLQRGWLVPAQNADNVGTVLSVVQKVDPESPLLSDPRLPGAFADGTEHALRMGQPVLADALVTAGATVAPRDKQLADLRAEVQRALLEQTQATLRAAATTRQRDETVAQWRSQLEEGLRQSTLSVAQAHTLSHLVEELQLQGDPGVVIAKRALETRLVRSARAIESRDGLDAAVKFTQEVYTLLPDSTKLGQMLAHWLATAAQKAATQRAAVLASANTEIEALLAHPTLDDSWDAALQSQLARLATYTPQTDPYVSEVRGRTATLYLTEAAQLRGTGHFDEAGRMLQRAGEYQPQSAEGGVEEALLADARARQTIGDRKPDRAAYVNSLKQKLLTQAEANEVTSAQTTLRVLRESLPLHDRFMDRDAPTAIAKAYGRLAWEAAGNGQLKSAVDLIHRGWAAAPYMESIAAAQERYVRYQELDDYLTGNAAPDVRKVRTEIAALYAQDPNSAQVLVPVLARSLASRLHATGDPQLALSLSRAGGAIFGDGPPLWRN